MYLIIIRNMQKSTLILIGGLILISVSVFGYIYLNASRNLQKAEQKQKIEEINNKVQLDNQEAEIKNNTNTINSQKNDEKEAKELNSQTKEDEGKKAVSLSSETIEKGTTDIMVTLSGEKKITGFNIVFNVSENATIDAIDPKLIVSNGDSSVYSQILNFISDNKKKCKSFLCLDSFG